MTLSWKALRRGALVAAVVTLLSSLMAASVSAQPPTPPNRFFGNVTLNGAAAPAGTAVSASVGGTACGQTTVQADSTYVLDAVSSGQTAGCGAEGASVSFTVGGSPAGTATWSSGQFTELDLAGAPAPPPTVAPPTVAPVTPTPRVVTGTGGYLDGGSGTAWWTYMAAGLSVLLLGTAGAAGYRRLRP
jgi:opacity protein-like surface antigen